MVIDTLTLFDVPPAQDAQVANILHAGVLRILAIGAPADLIRLEKRTSGAHTCFALHLFDLPDDCSEYAADEIGAIHTALESLDLPDDCIDIGELYISDDAAQRLKDRMPAIDLAGFQS